jgi:hypothetical protein
MTITLTPQMKVVTRAVGDQLIQRRLDLNAERTQLDEKKQQLTNRLHELSNNSKKTKQTTQLIKVAAELQTVVDKESAIASTLKRALIPAPFEPAASRGVDMWGGFSFVDLQFAKKLAGGGEAPHGKTLKTVFLSYELAIVFSVKLFLLSPAKDAKLRFAEGPAYTGMRTKGGAATEEKQKKPYLMWKQFVERYVKTVRAAQSVIERAGLVLHTWVSREGMVLGGGVTHLEDIKAELLQRSTEVIDLATHTAGGPVLQTTTGTDAKPVLRAATSAKSMFNSFRRVHFPEGATYILQLLEYLTETIDTVACAVGEASKAVRIAARRVTGQPGERINAAVIRTRSQSVSRSASQASVPGSPNSPSTRRSRSPSPFKPTSSSGRSRSRSANRNASHASVHSPSNSPPSSQSRSPSTPKPTSSGRGRTRNNRSCSPGNCASQKSRSRRRESSAVSSEAESESD